MSKDKKWIVSSELLFMTGLVLLSFGIVLMVRADLGMSVVSSLAYVISLRFQQFSLGTWSYLIQGFIVLLLVLFVRKVRLQYFLSFAVSVAFGLMVDFFSWLTVCLAGSDLPFQVLFFAAGLFLVTLGIALFVFSRLPVLPYDLFVKELASYKQISFRKCKMIFDLSCLTVSLIFLMLFVHRLVGIGIGTVISALLNGTLAGFWLKLFDHHLIPRSLLAKEKQPQNL